MTLAEIRDAVRITLADTIGSATDKLWSDSELNGYINRIVNTVAREARVISDSTTSAVCNISISGSSPQISYQLHSSIIQIDSVRLATGKYFLTQTSINNFENNPTWDTVSGSPTRYCLDATTGYITLNALATDNDTLKLRVKRMPLTALSKDSDTPELRLIYHDYLINGICSLAYLKQDTESFDINSYRRFNALFQDDLDTIKSLDSNYNHFDRSAGFNKANK